ncbi:MAG: hypothetical protein AAB483_02385 [Patescibacteria group bacterium]
MNPQTKNCKNCQSSFTIEPDDFGFYEKINVPPPTWCPTCRAMRRLTWRNERTLYKRKCDAPGHEEMLITNYSPETGIPVFDQKYWWSDAWDAIEYGREYDFTRPFFQQFRDLIRVVPIPNLINLEVVSSDYCNFTYQSKNCYLNFASDINEDSAYLHHTTHSNSSFDLLGCEKMNMCYECVHSFGCFNSTYLRFSNQCIDASLLYNCNNCQSCFGCVNLRNAKYMIFNQQYSKEEYVQELERMQVNTRDGFTVAWERFEKHRLQYPHRFATTLQVKNVSGDYLYNAKNCTMCFDIQGPAEDCKNVVYAIKDVRDCRDSHGLGIMEQGYELMGSGDNAFNMQFCSLIFVGNNTLYSSQCMRVANIFGCAGLKDKKYCILNKQYSKEEYEALVPKIIAQMKSTGEYGEFFPAAMSPFAYNETIAQEFFPLSKDEIIKKGFTWQEPEVKNYAIGGDIIACDHGGTCNDQCTTAFKLIPSELEFYERMKIPHPRLCPNCRHYQRLAQRNPLKLWHRKCMNAGCENEFETSYSPDRKETVYCEKCYQAEVS